MKKEVLKIIGIISIDKIFFNCYNFTNLVGVK